MSKQQVNGSGAEFLQVKEVAALARVTVRTVRNWTRSGELKTYRAGRRVLIAREDFERFLGKGRET